MDVNRALDLAEAARGELVALLEALLAAPSPVGDPAEEAQAVLSRWLERRGFDVRPSRDDPAAFRGHPEFSPLPPGARGAAVNLRAEPAAASPARLAFFAHVDTEPAGADWTRPPHRLTRRGRRLHGLGAADDKGGLAATAMAAVLGARHLGRAPTVLSIHGKAGGARGTLPAFLAASDPVAGAIYVHPPETGDGLSVLKTASRGVVDLDLRVRGWRGPAREIGNPESARAEDSGDALEAVLAVIESLRRSDDDLDVRVGRLDAGEAPGLVPLEARAGVRVLFDGDRTVAGVARAFREAAAECAAARRGPADRFRFEVASAGPSANPAATAWEDPLTRHLRDGVAAVTGAEPRPYAEHLMSDIRFPIRLAGVPSVGIGCRAGGFGGPDEWVDADDLVRLVAVLLLVLEASGDPGQSARPRLHGGKTALVSA